jgi:isochorismate pyruvate lyase
MKSPRECRNLTDVRAAVNAIDRDIIRLLGQRTKYALAALAFKTDLKQIAQPAHRRKLFAQRKLWAATHGVDQKLVGNIYQAIVDESERVHLAGFRARR